MTRAWKSTLAVALLMAVASQAGFAIEPNQVRGQVVDVDEAKRQVQLRVIESGSQRDAREGEVTSFYVPSDTDINYDLDSNRYSMYTSREESLRGLSRGDTVLLNFANRDQQRYALLIISENPRDPALRDRIRKEGRVMARDQLRSDPSERPARTAASAGAELGDTTMAARSELPASASPLPLLGLGGLAFAALAGGLRLRRRRRGS